MMARRRLARGGGHGFRVGLGRRMVRGGGGVGGFTVLAGGGCRRWGMAVDVVILVVGRVKALRQVGRSKRGGSDGLGEGGTCERG